MKENMEYLGVFYLPKYKFHKFPNNIFYNKTLKLSNWHSILDEINRFQMVLFHIWR
jgi:hypothetical protein